MTKKKMAKDQLLAGRIMLVDNETDLIELYPRELRKYGLAVDGFVDPVVALDEFIAKANDFVLVISDIRMPKMDGFEFVRSIRQIRPEIKVVFVTAFEINRDEFAKVLPSITVQGFIRKPISPSKLAELIKGFLKTEADATALE